jgi:hypothetical protein
MTQTGKQYLKIANLQIESSMIPTVPLWLSSVRCVLLQNCLKLGCTLRVFTTEQNTLIKCCVAHTTSNTALITLQDAHKSELVNYKVWLEAGASRLRQRGLNDVPLCHYTVILVYYTYTGIISV